MGIPLILGPCSLNSQNLRNFFLNFIFCLTSILFCSSCQVQEAQMIPQRSNRKNNQAPEDKPPRDDQYQLSQLEVVPRDPMLLFPHKAILNPSLFITNKRLECCHFRVPRSHMWLSAFRQTAQSSQVLTFPGLAMHAPIAFRQPSGPYAHT